MTKQERLKLLSNVRYRVLDTLYHLLKDTKAASYVIDLQRDSYPLTKAAILMKLKFFISCGGVVVPSMKYKRYLLELIEVIHKLHLPSNINEETLLYNAEHVHDVLFRIKQFFTGGGLAVVDTRYYAIQINHHFSLN